MINFRFHRGGFDEAMKEVYCFENLGEFFEFLRSRYSVKRQDFRLSPYGYDDRLESFSYIVTKKSSLDSTFYPIGFCWEDKR